MSRILFITQKINDQDDDLAFSILWIKQFIKEGFDVTTICLEKGSFDDSFPVYSLGKEEGLSKVQSALRFLKLVLTLQYDRVFVHMNPDYFTLGGFWWLLRGIPTYLWYTHYTMTIHLRFAAFVSKRMFAATPQSLPQFDGNPKKVILGHGIDTAFWTANPSSDTPDPYALVSVHRLSRSKRLEIAIRTLALLPPPYTLTVYGRPLDAEYFAELNALVAELGVASRVTFKGPLPMGQLRGVYPKHRLMLNFASETIDKTMLECMLFGIYPVTTKRNAEAIGLPLAPDDDTPQTVAAFILGKTWESTSKNDLVRIVEERHSLSSLVKKMGAYIGPGT